jgi:hypothetical protein
MSKFQLIVIRCRKETELTFTKSTVYVERLLNTIVTGMYTRNGCNFRLIITHSKMVENWWKPCVLLKSARKALAGPIARNTPQTRIFTVISISLSRRLSVKVHDGSEFNSRIEILRMPTSPFDCRAWYLCLCA